MIKFSLLGDTLFLPTMSQMNWSSTLKFMTPYLSGYLELKRKSVINLKQLSKSLEKREILPFLVNIFSLGCKKVKDTAK